MSSIPQTTALSKELQGLHREITTSEPSSDPASTSVLVKPGLIGARLAGRLRGYLHFSESDVYGPEDIFLLPEGETCNLPEGSSIKVLSGYKSDDMGQWYGFWFPRGGTLTGPLAWGWNPSANEKRDVLKYLRDEHLLQARLQASRIMKRRLIIPVSGGAVLGALASTFLGISSGAGLGAVAALVAMAIVGSRRKSLQESIMKTITSEETRGAADMPRNKQIFYMWLPDKAKPAFAYLAPPCAEEGVARKIDQVDEEIVRSLMEYGALLKQVTDVKGDKAQSDRRLIRHMATTIDEIASNLTRRPKLRQNEALKSSLLNLIRRARDEVRQVLEQEEMRDSEGLMAAISALQLQMDRHGSSRRPELVSENKTEESTQS